MTVTRSCVPRGVEDDPGMDAQWFEHLRASATAMELPGTGPTTGKPMGHRGHSRR